MLPRLVIIIASFITAQAVYAQPGQWTWVSGDSVNSPSGSFGTKGVAAPGNAPNSVSLCTRWLDNEGNLWLFGGNSNFNSYNALWKFDTKTLMWTWMKGDSLPNQPSIYATKGKPSDWGCPGARANAAGWTDKEGNLWLFGGGGIDLNGSIGRLNDLWRYNIKENRWAWIHGETSPNSMGSYGTQGVESGTNTPPAKEPVTGELTDEAGNLLLYSGYNHYDFATVNELWRFNIKTYNWTFVSGIPTYVAPAISVPNYGPKGAYSNTYHPGGRNYYCAWTRDSLAYLFSGDSYRGNGISDLWACKTATAEWSWIGGSLGSSGITNGYCKQEQVDYPSSRVASLYHQAPCNGFFLYGGLNRNSNHLSDFWYYNPLTSLWTCISGDDTSASRQPNYGIKNTGNALNTPGSRACGSMWIDKNNTLWLFGGQNEYLPFSVIHTKNDLWRYDIDWACLGDTLISNCVKPVIIPVEEVKIPNVFTPGHDGLNDRFNVQLKNCKVHDVVVYNRWGQPVYRDTNKVDWDGSYNGSVCTDGTYYYIITLQRLNGSVETVNGVLTLVRG